MDESLARSSSKEFYSCDLEKRIELFKLEIVHPISAPVSLTLRTIHKCKEVYTFLFNFFYVRLLDFAILLKARLEE